MFHPPGLRLAILALTAVAQALLATNVFLSVLIALTFSHYAMALYFARARANVLLHEPKTRLPLLLLGLTIIASAFLDLPIMILVFGIHHVFNELYLSERRLAVNSSGEKWARALFETCLYAALVHPELNDLTGGRLNIQVLTAMLCFSTGILALTTLSRGWSREELLFSGGGLAVAALCLRTGLGGLDFVLYYHFTYWAMAPLQTLASEGSRALIHYILITLIPIAAVLVLFTPLMLHFGGASFETLSHFTRIGAYFHILSSFALSKAHPRFIRQWFEISESQNSESAQKAA